MNILNLNESENQGSLLRVLIFSWRGPGHPDAGGAEESTHEHAKAWVRAGHHVTLFTSRHKGSKAEEKVDGVNIVRRGNMVFGVHLAAAWRYLFGKHLDFDLVVDQFHGIPFFTPLFIRKPKLAFIHEVAKEVWSLNPWPRPLNLIPAIVGRIGEPWVFRILYRGIPFMTVSESTKKDLVGWGIPSENVTVINNGVNIVRPKKGVGKEKRKTAVYLGALSRDKGVEDALEAFSIINKEDPSWQFWIIGKGDESYVRKLKAIVNRLGLGNKLKFWGYVPDEKKFELLARAHVMVNPSVREGWGLVNIEANAVGTPVVAYNAPGLRDSIVNGKTGLLADLCNPEGLASKALRLIDDSELYSRFQKEAVAWSRKFKWKEAGRKSVELLENLKSRGE